MSKNSDFGRFRWDSSGQVGCCRSGEAHGETLKLEDKDRAEVVSFLLNSILM